MGAPKGGREPDAVCLAYVHQNEYAHSWADSREQLVAYDLTHHGRLIRGGYINMRCGTDGLSEARNKAVASFLEQDVPWLFWTDTDMGFTPDSLERLMAVADPVERPIVGGLCFTQREYARDGFNGFRTMAKPTILDWIKTAEDEPPKFTARDWYPPETVVKCGGTGSAFLVIHRGVFEKLRAEYGDNWYSRIRGDDGTPIGEDISFCIRAHIQGFPVHVDTGTKTTHMKNVWLQEEDFWDQQEAPPATENVDVLIDGDASETLRASLKASTGLAGRNEVRDFPMSWTEPWVFIAPPDAVFGPGWYDHAVYTALRASADVVGTRGGLLIKRSYIDEHGASWDGPGSLVHDGYESYAAKVSEIMEIAKQRDTFVLSYASKVSVESPPELSKHDKRLYEARSRKFGRAA